MTSSPKKEASKQEPFVSPTASLKAYLQLSTLSFGDEEDALEKGDELGSWTRHDSRSSQPQSSFADKQFTGRALKSPGKARKGRKNSGGNSVRGTGIVLKEEEVNKRGQGKSEQSSKRERYYTWNASPPLSSPPLVLAPEIPKGGEKVQERAESEAKLERGPPKSAEPSLRHAKIRFEEEEEPSTAVEPSSMTAEQERSAASRERQRVPSRQKDSLHKPQRSREPRQRADVDAREARRHKGRFLKMPEFVPRRPESLKTFSRLSTPSGFASSMLLADEMSTLFREDEDQRLERNLNSFGKYALVRQLELQLKEALDEADLIWKRPPLTEARKKAYDFLLPKLFDIFDEILLSTGPFGKVLRTIKDELYKCCYSDEQDYLKPTGHKVAWVQLVPEMKRERERALSALTTNEVLLKQTEKELKEVKKEKENLENQLFNIQQRASNTNEQASKTESLLKKMKAEYEELKYKFDQLQKGFLLGELQDDMREMLLEGAKQDAKIANTMERQSAMHNLIQQLKDAKDAMLNAKDDVNYWRGKYEAVSKRMEAMTESFQDMSSVLEMTKEKMTGMVPSAVHVALKQRYTEALKEIESMRDYQEAEKKKNRTHEAAKERKDEGWQNYDKSSETSHRSTSSMAPSDHKHGTGMDRDDLDTDWDTREDAVPSEFLDSVSKQRANLVASYKAYRRLSGTSVVDWTQLKNMTLAEFAKLEEDCFSQNSLWALALQGEK
ncbi:hypothetical protein GUITHDRAFT_165809 [Guillardia theta CCMP2712]|uniref:Uncharacterized protein n=1 Tax=Guillardia theta (strain CCMP2712) TaxID=905079 RepID=L1IIZ9_GUITC|nr:hypothetical protein GUITHDRAFT_165809 [Guillardia theta CCMP2712]EKX36238.1 hypothetical protein GUITHDRAFT_165809 [Guillardia theta CCMP2712]|eukprot:XP_005823218.1 hypothetical protein GUITHDRAFT_165809 [Guillardia theta CCMP2712]